MMFITVDDATLAARFANGGWDEISLILTLVDRFVREAGWSGAILGNYLGQLRALVSVVRPIPGISRKRWGGRFWGKPKGSD